MLALPIGEETEMPDAHEARGEHVQKKPSKKLFDAKRHHAFLVAMSRIAPAKADLLVGDRDQPVVGDGDAMSVVAQVLENLFGSAPASAASIVLA
jgi:hypothetical protein